MIELREHTPGRYSVRWQTGGDADADESGLELPPRCTALTAPMRDPVATRTVRRWEIDCGPRGLAGERVGVSFARDTAHLVILHVHTADGATHTRPLRAYAPRAVIPGAHAPARDAPDDAFRAYLTLGLAHIATGWDHLALLVALLLLVRAARPLALAVTAFTFGHSASLALAALSLVRLPAAPVEALIAASVALLAAEIARARNDTPAAARPPDTRPPDTLPPTQWRGARLALVPFAFGLVHGLGFASALNDAGLPRGGRALALFAFNLGVELGQLAFVLAMLALTHVARRITPARTHAPARVTLAYATGVAASFALFARIALFWR